MVGGVGLEPTRLGEAADFKSAVSTCSTTRPLWRRRPESNRGIAVLQTAALPLGYAAENGAGDGIRTRDLQPGELTLYH